MATASAAPVASIREILTPDLRRLLLGIGLSSAGNGLAIGLFIVYLHQIRGLPLEASGLLLTYEALLGLLCAPAVGAIVDRVGPRPVLLTALAVMAVATWSFASVTTMPQAVVVATGMALGNSMTWPPQMVLLTRLVPEDHRQRAYGLQFMLLNLGLGIGGLIAALVLDAHRPETFEWLYRFNGVTFLVYLAVLLTIRSVSGPEDEHEDGASSGGYREVLADRRMSRLLK